MYKYPLNAKVQRIIAVKSSLKQEKPAVKAGFSPITEGCHNIYEAEQQSTTSIGAAAPHGAGSLRQAICILTAAKILDHNRHPADHADHNIRPGCQKAGKAAGLLPPLTVRWGQRDHARADFRLCDRLIAG